MPLPSEMLWTSKYAPTELKQICGNKTQVERLTLWLQKWYRYMPVHFTPALTMSRQESMKANFKKPGKDGMNVFRAVLITGPPGIGKTTTAHLVATAAGYTPLELNASDSRSKKLVEVCRSPSCRSALTQCRTGRIFQTRASTAGSQATASQLRTQRASRSMIGLV